MKPITSTLRVLTIIAAGLLTAQLAQAQSIWNGTNGVALNTNWSTAANWLPTGVPGATANVVFTNNATAATAGVINNVVDASLSIQSLAYQATSKLYHTTLISPNTTLTITGSVATALFVGTGLDSGATLVNAAIQGGGTLLITNTSGIVNVRQGSQSASYTTHVATLDLSGLTNFTAYVSRILVAGDGLSGVNYAQMRENGTLFLAQTNLIVCAAASPTAGLLIADATGYAGRGIVYLGQTNAFFSDGGITVGAAKSSASTLGFASSVVNGSALFRDRAGTGRQSQWLIAYNRISSSTASSGTADFSLGTVDALVDTMYVAYGNSTSIATGVLTFGNGTIDVNTLEIGYQALSGSSAYGTVNVNGGQLTVNNNLRLARNLSGVPTGALNVNGGSVWVKGNIIDGGGFNQSVTVTSGSLKVGGTVGSSLIPLQSMILNNATLTFDLGLSSNPTQPLWQIGVLTVTAPVTNNVLGSALTLGQFTLIKYASGNDGTGFTLGSLPSHIGGYLSNNIAHSSIDLVITNVATPKWNGTVAGGAWDINATANWVPTSGGAAMTYLQASVPGDSVLFDDTATGTTTVNLTTTLSPSGITVNNSLSNYTFTGSGGLSGPTGLTKTGSGTLTIANTGTNDFAGAVVINGGKVQVAGSADRLSTNAAVSLADDSTALLDLNNTNQMLGSLSGGGGTGGNVTLGRGTLNIAADGGVYSGVISGGGAVIKSGSGTQVFNGANLYDGGTLVSGGKLTVANTAGSGTGSGGIVVATNATFQIGDGGADGSIAVGTITNNGSVALNRSDDLTFTTLVTGGGGLAKYSANTVLIPTSNTYTGQTTIYYGALRVSDPGALGTGRTYISTDPTARLELTGGITLTQAISVTMKGAVTGSMPPAMVNVDGTNTLAGPITGLSGGTYWTFEIDAGKLVVTGSFTPSGPTAQNVLRLTGNGDCEWWGSITNSGNTGLAMSGAGTWTLGGNNTYIGKTTVASGRLIVNGALLASTNITVTGGTLGGTGLITGPVFIGGTLAPGASIGTLTISNSLTLSNGCVAVMEVSHSAYDRVVGLSSVALGGTLQVIVTNTLLGGEAFKLFDATSYSGDFATYDLPTLMSPLSWDTNSVPVDGTLRVAGSIQPQIATMTVTGDHNFQFSGTGPTNWTYWILATTNVAEPLGNWVPVATNTFINGAFNWTDLHATNYARRFYLVTTEAP